MKYEQEAGGKYTIVVREPEGEKKLLGNQGVYMMILR
jgi:hypothetical protein